MTKLQKAGIVAGIVLIVAAALLTALSIAGRNKLYRSSNLSYDIPMDMPTGIGMGGGLGVQDSFSVDESAPRMLQKEMAVEDQSGSPEMVVTDKKIIKNGNLTMKVDRLSDAQAKISTIASENGGNIFSTSISQSKDNIKSGYITVKVPVNNFEKALEEIKKTAALVVHESASGTDVTEEYQDLETQINNKKAEEASYVRILDQAQEIEDVLAVTKQISRVRGEIERLEGRIKYLATQADMSTITVNLSEDQNITVTDSWRPLQIAKDAVNALVKNVQGFLSFLIVLVITFIPVAILYLLLILVIFLVARKIWRKVKAKKEVSN